MPFVDDQAEHRRTASFELVALEATDVEVREISPTPFQNHTKRGKAVGSDHAPIQESASMRLSTFLMLLKKHQRGIEPFWGRPNVSGEKWARFTLLPKLECIVALAHTVVDLKYT